MTRYGQYKLNLGVFGGFLVLGFFWRGGGARVGRKVGLRGMGSGCDRGAVYEIPQIINKIIWERSKVPQQRS